MEKTKEHLGFLISHIQPTLEFFHEKDLTDGQLLVVGFLERLLFACLHLDIVLQNPQQAKRLEFSAGLTIRPILLDAMICLNLVTVLLESEEKGESNESKIQIIEEYAPKILSDGIKKIINFTEDFCAAGHISADQKTDYYKKFAGEYSKYFEEYKMNGSKPILKQKGNLMALSLFKNLTKHPDTNELSKIYNMYIFYSQYDHFSAMYFKTRNVDLSFRLQFLQNSVLLFVNHSLTLLTILNQIMENEFTQSKFKIFREYTISTIE